MFVPEAILGKGFKGDRCIVHGSKTVVGPDYSCGVFAPWPTPDGSPNREVQEDHAAELRKGIPGSFTPDQSGLVKQRVQCHRCEYHANPQVTRCGLYIHLNKVLPELFKLKTEIKPHACCNAWEPKTQDGAKAHVDKIIKHIRRSK